MPSIVLALLINWACIVDAEHSIIATSKYSLLNLFCRALKYVFVMIKSLMQSVEKKFVFIRITL